MAMMVTDNGTEMVPDCSQPSAGAGILLLIMNPFLPPSGMRPFRSPQKTPSSTIYLHVVQGTTGSHSITTLILNPRGTPLLFFF